MARPPIVNSLPALDSALGDRIRYVVDLFDRKKDAAQIAGVIPEQLNRWCQAQSEPRFVGITRLALSQGVSLEWIATGNGEIQSHANGKTTPQHATPSPNDTQLKKRDILIAIISGFLTAEDVENGPQIAQDIIASYDEIVENIENNRDHSEMAIILSQVITAILTRQQQRSFRKE